MGKIKHGLCKSRFWNRYTSMVTRCTNKNVPRYKDWGGKGIIICKEWLDNPQSYIDHAESIWFEGCTFDKDIMCKKLGLNEYSPKTLIAVTQKENNQHKRSNIYYKGKCLKQWAEKLGLDYKKVHRRFKRDGWSIERSLELIK